MKARGMKYKLRKAGIAGRNKQDRAIYPCGSWTLWYGDTFIGWNWSWGRIWNELHSGTKIIFWG